MKLKGEIIQNYIKSYVPLIIKLLIVIPTAITIMNYYLGYQLSTLTKSLITSVNLPSDVWNWIVVLCWLCGLYIAAVTAVFLIILEVLIINFFKFKPLLTIISIITMDVQHLLLLLLWKLEMTLSRYVNLALAQDVSHLQYQNI